MNNSQCNLKLVPYKYFVTTCASDNILLLRIWPKTQTLTSNTTTVSIAHICYLWSCWNWHQRWRFVVTNCIISGIRRNVLSVFLLPVNFTENKADESPNNTGNAKSYPDDDGIRHFLLPENKKTTIAGNRNKGTQSAKSYGTFTWINIIIRNAF